jgi:ABC-type phosphate transport system substrate-binding protein
VGTLSADQVAKIFMGKSKAFPDGSTAVPIEQSEGSAARDAFHRKVTGKDAAQLKAYWSRLIFSGKGQPPKDVGDDAAVKAAVASTPGAIGYLDAALVDGSIKVVLTP